MARKTFGHMGRLLASSARGSIAGGGRGHRKLGRRIRSIGPAHYGAPHRDGIPFAGFTRRRKRSR